jgi:ABC-2 type transport system permease protein
MNPGGHAVRVGLRRGWTEFVLSLRSGQDQSFYLVVGLAVLGYLWINRTGTVDGSDLSYPAVALPGILGSFLVLGTVIGPGFALATEKEDGTLLRARATPHGLVGYVAGQVVYHALSILPLLLMVLVPSLLLLDVPVPATTGAWLRFVALVALAVVATLPLGLALGALSPDSRRVGTWGMLPFVGVTAISGIYFPMAALWPWVQVLAQVFPVYWVGLGMRSVFLPDAAATLEITGTWRTTETFAVLGAWAVAGLCLTPILLRRAVRRQSGAAVAAARHQAAHYVR